MPSRALADLRRRASLAARCAAVVTLMLTAAVQRPAWAADDYATTDFQTDLQPPPGLQLFYNPGLLLTPSDVKGSVVQQRYGVMVTPVRGVDLFAHGQHLNFDVQRTNRYAFALAGRNLGLRLAVLPEWRNPVGVDVGVTHEATYPNHLFRNGADLLLTSPADDCLYTFVLASRRMTPRLRLNGGLKWGTVHVGPQQGRAWSWSLGAEQFLRKDLDLGLVFKQSYLQGQSTNEMLSLRVRWKPVPPLRVQLEGNLFSHGLRAQVPALSPYSTVSFSQRFEGKAMASIGINLTYTFGWGSTPASEAATAPAQPAPPADTPLLPTGPSSESAPRPR